MRPKNEIFAKALDWLYKNGMVDDQKDLSEKTGIDKTTISRILNDQVKKPSDITLRKLNATFGGVFNLLWLRGESDVMLANGPEKETETVGADKQGKIIEVLEEKNMLLQHQVKLVEESAQREIAAKNETIAALKGQLKDKEELNAKLKSEIAILKEKLSKYQQEESIGEYNFPIGVAEDSNYQKKENI